MNNEITVTRTITAPVENVFPYFIESGKIERWSAPEGMTLKVPFFEPHPGGKYRYEHMAKNGVYVCEGHIEEIIPEKKITMVDEFIRAPDGSQMKNIDCTATFVRKGAETEVRIVTSGFEDVTAAKECEQGWNQCLDNLEKIAGRNDMRLAG